jgi:hypothetical protein
MGRFFFFLVTFSVSMAPTAIASDSSIITVRYISSEHIYIDAGSEDGVSVSDTLYLIGEGNIRTKLEVIHVSSHSASCLSSRPGAEIKVGDLVELNSVNQALPEPADSATVEHPPVIEPRTVEVFPEKETNQERTRLSGGVSFSYYHWDDREQSNLDFHQPGLRLRLNADRLWGSDLSLRYRSRTRYNRRSKQYSGNVSQKEWRNTVYELSIGIGDDDGSGFRLGRIIPRKLSGIGYLDGIYLQQRLTGSLAGGVFGGTRPEWQYTSPQTSIQKYGLFINFAAGERELFRLETTLALAAEYHSSVISREFLHVRNVAARGTSLRLYQSADIDINRGWRGERASQRLSISNLYVSGRYRPSRWMTLGLSFDNRQRYWTYDQRTLADSLFDDLVRRGARASVDLNLPESFRLGSSFGLRSREGQSRTTSSYSVNLRKTGISRARLNFNIYLAGFSNHYADGFNITYGIGKYFRRGHQIRISYGIYSYDYIQTDTRRSSRSLQFTGNIVLPARMNLMWEMRESSGDDIDGRTFLAEIGYRFK